MMFLEGDLLRRGLNQNETPVRQVCAYLEKFEDFVQMENAFASTE